MNQEVLVYLTFRYYVGDKPQDVSISRDMSVRNY
jgi:hypothetical protein